MANAGFVYILLFFPILFMVAILSKGRFIYLPLLPGALVHVTMHIILGENNAFAWDLVGLQMRIPSNNLLV